jgi:cytochrome c oxidase subunit II
MKRIAPLLLTNCLFAQQSALSPAGSNAKAIYSLTIFFVWLLGAIFLIVIAIALATLFRRHRGIEQEPLEQTHRPSDATERKLGTVVLVATSATVVILIGLIILSVSVGKATSRLPDQRNGIAIEIMGNQWWWYVRYPNNDPSRILVTANELHVPVGRPVLIRGMSNDVIHSFWVPNLQGKRDLIPGRVTSQWFQANSPGRFRGQCAEFCGFQHAHMAFWVVAEPEDQFQAWMAHQLQPAGPPADSLRQRGQQVFLESGCVLCHSIQGTPAAGQVGPDLTHFGSRLTIAAGTLRNTKGNLAGWIADPQSVKPGTHMATIPVKSSDMQPLLEYLESLQ